MKTAVIYARYSCERQTEQSIEGQLHVCKDYAERNNIIIVDTYIDRAMSGTNDNRKDFQRLLKNSSKKAWDFVLVYKLDRFSRNKYESAIHKKTLRDNGIKLISATENIPETPEGIILESLLEGMAEYYSAELAQKVKRGMKETRQKGFTQGGAIPFGYKVVDRKYVINEDEAEIVRYIYAQYISGVCAKNITKELNKRGVKNRSGDPITIKGVYFILKSEKYTGVYRHKEEIHYNMFPRIISDEVFNTVRQLSAENHYGKHITETVYLLKNLVKCGYCGKTVQSESGTGKLGKTLRYYKCSGRKREKSCKKSIIRKEILEDIIVNTTLKVFTDGTNIYELAEKLLNKLNDQIHNQSVLNLLENERSELQKSLNNMLDAVEKGIFTNSTKQRIEELENKIEDIDTKILLEKSHTKTLLTPKEIVGYIKKALSKNPRIMLKMLIKEIILYDNRIEIYYKHNDRQNPDESKTRQGFSFYMNKIDKFTIDNKVFTLNIEIICFL